MGIRKTSVAIDDELLARAKEVLHTDTVKETIQQAFIELLRARARREEVEALSELRHMDLGNAKIMSGAWRH